jgi:hypothetical protein
MDPNRPLQGRKGKSMDDLARYLAARVSKIHLNSSKFGEIWCIWSGPKLHFRPVSTKITQKSVKFRFDRIQILGVNRIFEHYTTGKCHSFIDAFKFIGTDEYIQIIFVG